MTINAASGVNSKIQDRFDLTLECIRRFYAQEESPLKVTLERDISFFNLFQDFKVYVDFFFIILIHQMEPILAKVLLRYSGYVQVFL